MFIQSAHYIHRMLILYIECSFCAQMCLIKSNFGWGCSKSYEGKVSQNVIYLIETLVLCVLYLSGVKHSILSPIHVISEKFALILQLRIISFVCAD